MAWETTLYTAIRFNRKTYESKYQVEDDIDELSKSIKRTEEELRDLAMMTEPEKMLKSSGDDENASPYDLISWRFNELIEILHEDIVERAKLYLLQEEWDKCHDKESGLAIGRPENFHWDDSFMDGDFIKTVQNPKNGNSIFDFDSKDDSRADDETT